MKIKSEEKTESAILIRRWKEGQHLTLWRNVGVIALCKNKTKYCQGFWRNWFQRSFFISLSLLANDRTNRQGKRLGSSPAATKAKTDTRGIIFELAFFSGV